MRKNYQGAAWVIIFTMTLVVPNIVHDWGTKRWIYFLAALLLAGLVVLSYRRKLTDEIKDPLG